MLLATFAVAQRHRGEQKRRTADRSHVSREKPSSQRICCMHHVPPFPSTLDSVQLCTNVSLHHFTIAAL